MSDDDLRFICPGPGCGLDVTDAVIEKVTAKHDPIFLIADLAVPPTPAEAPVSADKVVVTCGNGHTAAYPIAGIPRDD